MQAAEEDVVTPEWAQVISTASIGLLQIGLIAWGLWQMRNASAERNKQLDQMQADSDRRFDYQHTALMDLLKRTEH